MPHVHKPKPFSNWREFLSEIATIVLGVLIALSAEQAVEAIHWAHKIDQAEESLRLELSTDDGPQAYARASVTTCLQEKLTAMRKMVLARGDRQAFLAIARTYRPPSRTWDAEAWRAVVASDVGTHMGSDRIVSWSTPFRLIPNMNYSNGRELDDTDAIRGVPDEPGPLTQEEVERLSLALTRLRTDNLYFGVAATLMLIDSKAVGSDVPEAHKRAILAEARANWGACVSPPNYRPISGGIGQFLKQDQEAALMQYHGDPASAPEAW